MLLILDDEHKQHLQFISSVDEPVAKEFCKIANEFLVRGVNPKVYHSAAQKLQVDDDVVQGAVEGLSHLLSQAAKLKLGEQHLRESLLLLSFPESVCEELVKHHVDNERNVRKLLSEKSIPCWSFSHLQWRLEAEVASRCLKSHVTPLVTFKFHLKQGDGSETKEVVLQTDPLNLLHMTESLEEALQSAKSLHMRRIAKHVK
ncbi:COMM domain-containing protein 2 [Dermacentor variabilis]|uniref:COMM domain-containing protein 2 n=1 Tax=Dermacentor variabilis TaxID=34621 RepID=UPI003F5ADE8E